MLNYQSDRTDLRSLQINQRAVERHVNDDHYVRGFTPGDFVLIGSATHVVVTVASQLWAAIEMPDAAQSNAFASFRKPSEWRTGHMRIRFWYTSDVGSTNNFRIRLDASAMRTAEVLPSTALLSAAALYAGPAVASTVVRSVHVYTTTALGSDDEIFSIGVTRLGAGAGDDNVNDFQLLYVEVEHIPAQQVSQ